MEKKTHLSKIIKRTKALEKRKRENPK